MATLQHALIRAIETEHVLETGELLGEPLPTRDQRNAILFYEASEGGAGVLKRLMEGPERWQQLARAALDIMHYHEVGGFFEEAPDACVAGCYRCVLSYYNQPDHELIDRRDPEVIAILHQLAGAQRDRPSGYSGNAGSDGGPWLTALAGWGAPPPLTELIAGDEYPLCWPHLMVMAVIGDPSGDLRKRCNEIGRSLIGLPQVPGERMPADLASALGLTG